MKEHFKSCSYCKKDITGGTFITTSEGMAHELCYHKENPFKEKDDFIGVLQNSDDQVLVRQLLESLVPDNIKYEIVSNFNGIMKKRHDKRLEFLKDK